MGFTNTTAHYELPQYLATDHPKYLTDFNQAMAAIDAGMYENAGAAATADSKADAAQATADSNTSSIGTLDTQINGNGSTTFGLAGDVSGLQGSVNTINSLIGNGTPTTTDKTIIGAINEINAKVTPEAVQVETLAAAGTSVEFDVPTSGDNLIDFYVSDGSQPTAIDTSVSGKVTLTFTAAAYARSVFCKIETVTVSQ